MGAGSVVDAGLEAGVEAVGGRGLGIEGLHVHRHGKAPAEHHWVADIRRDVYSISKTFTSVAVDIAEAEGLLDVDDAVLQLRTEEIARLGRTLLDQGRYRGRQLIPAEYVDAMITNTLPTGQLTSHYQGPTTDILDAIWSDIVPALG